MTQVSDILIESHEKLALFDLNSFYRYARALLNKR